MTASTLFDIGPGDRPRRELAPGAVHVPSWLTTGQQQWLVERFREWTRGPVPIRAAKVRGHEMSVRTVCLGWHWQPYQYTREAISRFAAGERLQGMDTKPPFQKVMADQGATVLRICRVLLVGPDADDARSENRLSPTRESFPAPADPGTLARLHRRLEADSAEKGNP